MQINFKVKFSRLILLFVCIGLVVASIAAVWFGNRYISASLIRNEEKIKTTLKEELGFPVVFDKPSVGLFGVSFGVVFKNVVLSYGQKPVSFIRIEKLVLIPKVIDLLWKDTISLKEMRIEGLKATASWDEQKGLSLLDEKHNPLPIAFNSLFSQGDSNVVEKISFKRAEFYVLLKKETLIAQIEGAFKINPSADAEWEFEGSQAVQMEKGEMLPWSPLFVAQRAKTKAIEVKLGKNPLKIQAEFLPNDSGKTQIYLEAHFNGFSFPLLPNYYPIKPTDPAWLRWTVEAIKTGEISDGNIKISGTQNNLQCEGELDFYNATLVFDKTWPALVDMEGKLKLSSNEVAIEVDDAEIFNTPIKTLSASIGPLQQKDSPRVRIEGSLNSNLTTGVQFLLKSPLKDSIGETLQMLSPTGKMALNLNLEIPLSEEKTRVTGRVQIEKGHFQQKEWGVELNKVTGEFQFTEKSLNAPLVTAEFQEEPIKLQVETLETTPPKLNIKTDRTLSAQFLQDKLNSELMKKITGTAQFEVGIIVPLLGNPTHAVAWRMASTLEGMTIDLPSPFGKTEKTQLPMVVEIALNPDEEKRTARKVHVSLAGIMEAKLELISSEKATLKRGHIVFGKDPKADWTTSDALLVNGTLPDLVISEWQPYLASHKENPLLPPIQIQVLAENLDAYGLLFANTWLTADLAKKPVEWVVDGPALTGKIILPSGNKPLELNLALLKLSSSDMAGERSLSMLTEQEKFPISFRCRDFHYNNNSFGELAFTLSPESYGYKIPSFTVAERFYEISGEGEWHFGKGDNRTVLDGKMISANMGGAFARLGSLTTVQGSSGYLKYHVSWAAAPTQFKLSALRGEAEFKLEKGHIMGIDPGLGKVLGLLNLETIHRRLQLDLSDITKKGFAFDTLSGKIEFQDGLAKTPLFFIDGPSSVIELNGTANLSTKMLDLNMMVAPKLGTLPITAGGLAGGPVGLAGGVGVYLIDKLTGSKMQLIRYYYHVSGSWDAPQIKSMGDTRREKK